MSKIISPRDSIVIDIDGMTGNVSFKPSRELPGLYVVYILNRLASEIAAQGLKAGEALAAAAGGIQNGDQTKQG